MKRITTRTAPAVQELLVLGFDNQSYILLNEQDGTDYFNFVTFDHSNQALTYLKNVGVHSPGAIICSYEYLRNNHFQFLTDITADSNLKNIPFIVISADGLDMPVERALRMGIDDCYTEPVNWSNLMKRVAFLSKHKQDLLTDWPEVVDHQYQLETPVGKRIFDCLVALVIATLFSPVILFIILAIKATSPGPVIYRSKRIGKGYKAFDFFKFRSMCVDADDQRDAVSHLSQQGGAFLKVKNDPRVTRIGWLIRKTSLDELPQLLNVIRGDMSIIGNRPLPLSEAEQITIDKWAARFLAPAGITGLWQTAPGGKENLTQEERIALDIEYAQKLSMVMDAKILLRTIPAMIQKGE